MSDNNMTFASVDFVIPQALGGDKAHREYIQVAAGVSGGISQSLSGATNSLPNDISGYRGR
jgi:hypothetical protein